MNTIPNGIYTVCFKDNDNRTIRIRDGFENKPGSQIAEYLYGQDNESNYRGFATILDGKARIWKKFEGFARVNKTASRAVISLNFLLGSDEAKLQECGIRYAVKSGNCYRCGRTLTVESSVMQGLGPVCAEKIGWTAPVSQPAALAMHVLAGTSNVAEAWNRV